MKFIKVGNKATIKLSDGTFIMLTEFSEEDLKFMMEVEDESLVKTRFLKEFKEYNEAVSKDLSNSNSVQDSEWLEYADGKFYFPSISEISVPSYLVEKFNKAEKEKNSVLINTYLNFWNLACQNENAEARNNLLWFLEYHGFKILESGLFVTYRNVVSKNKYFSDSEVELLLNEFSKIKKWKKSPKNYTVIRDRETSELKVVYNSLVDSESQVEGNLFDLVKSEDSNEFTDNYTKSMTIKLGIPVKIERNKCDEDSNNECSRGLHLSHKNWSSLENFGDTTIMCLCNPANVVAVPKRGSYNKIRTCEYFPVEIVERTDEGKIIEKVNDGDVLTYFDISYDGVINNKDASAFQLKIPKYPGLNSDKVIENLEHARSVIKNKIV